MDIHNRFEHFLDDYLDTLNEMNDDNFKKKENKVEELIYQFHLELDHSLNQERIKILKKQIKKNEMSYN